MKIKFLGLLCSLFFLLPCWQQNLANAQSLEVQKYFPSNPDSPAMKYVFALDANEILWAANERAELYSFQNGSWIEEALSPELNSAIRTIQFDESGRLWLGTQFQGVFMRSGNDWLRFHTLNSGIFSNNIFDIVFDGQGHTWINHGAFGLSKWDGSTWVTYNSDQGDFPSGMITAIASNEADRFWCVLGKYLFEYSQGEWMELDLDQDFNQTGTVISNLNWTDGELLVSSNKGLYILNEDQEWTWPSEPLGEVLVTDVVRFSNGKYCFAQAGYGLHFLDGEEIDSYFGTSANQIPHLILEMELETDGTIWLANAIGGICAVKESLTSTESQEKCKIQLFPNPTHGNLFLKDNVCSTDGRFDVCIYDALGQLKAVDKDTDEMDVSFLSAGWYSVVIRSQKQQEVWIQTILIQH